MHLLRNINFNLDRTAGNKKIRRKCRNEFLYIIAFYDSDKPAHRANPSEIKSYFVPRSGKNIITMGIRIIRKIISHIQNTV